MKPLVRSAALLLTLAGVAAPVVAQEAPALEKYKEKPSRLSDKVGQEAQVVDRRGAVIPLDLAFVDEAGQKVRLRDYFQQDKPVLLQFVYYRCPNLCNVVLDGAIDVVSRMKMLPGKEFEVVTISINPEETSNLARGKKEGYMRALAKHRPDAAEAGAGWHFLTGRRKNIQAAALAAGFGYRFDTDTREYAHGAALFVLTPQGKISRTIFGAMYEPKTVRLSLVEAADGKVGTALDRILLYCYHFDPTAGKYTVQVMNVARAVGGLTVLFLFTMIGGFLWRERRLKHVTKEVAPSEPTAAPTSPGEVLT